MFIDYVVMKHPNLQFAYNSLEEMKEHFASGEVVIPVKDAVEYAEEFFISGHVVNSPQTIQVAHPASSLEEISAEAPIQGRDVNFRTSARFTALNTASGQPSNGNSLTDEAEKIYQWLIKEDDSQKK